MGEDTTAPAAGRRRSALGLTAAVLLASWLLVAWPVLAGNRTFFYRDLFSYFAPLKAFGAMELVHGRIPALNPTWSLGQPWRGDPNALPFYPTNLLYVVLPFWTAFNLHLLLHWLLAAVSMVALARGLGYRAEAALLAGLAYGGGGIVLSATSFYSTITVLAWWPLVLLAAHRGSRRTLAAGALCCGLALLGGEPVFAAIGLVPLLVIAVRRWGWRRGLAVAAAIGAGGCLVALPQIVATLRILPDSFRGSHGVTGEEAMLYRLHPFRLLELLRPASLRGAPWPRSWIARVPYFYAIYPGVIATVLALAGARRQRAFAALCAAALLVAWLPLIPGSEVARGSFGLFRYPEKALFWLALGLPLLAAGGLDRAARAPQDALRAAAIVGGALAIVAVTTTWVSAPDARPGDALALALLLVALCAWAIWRRLTIVVVLLELAALVPMQSVLLTDDRAFYERPAPWYRQLGERRLVARFEQPEPRGTIVEQARRRSRGLDKVPGVLFGVAYPVSPNVCGLHNWRESFLEDRLGAAHVPLIWLRTLGVEAVVAPAPLAGQGIRLVTSNGEGADREFLAVLEGPSPAVWWPQALEVATGPMDAFNAVARHADPTTRAVVPFRLPHVAGARLRVVRAEPDRVVVDCDGGGGLLVVRRAFQPLWRARSGGQALRVLPADLALTGIVVPPGQQRVELFVSSTPEIAAGVVAGIATCALAIIALWRRARREGDRTLAVS